MTGAVSIDRAARRRAGWDIGLSAALIVLTWGAVLLGSVFAVFSVFAGDSCAPAQCAFGSALGAEFAAGLVAVAAAVVGTAVTVLLLVHRRRGWWAALVAGLLVAASWITGFWVFGGVVAAGLRP